MSFKFKSRLQYKALIDITALVDLVFLLVAFFMVTSSLGSESAITVHLPKAVQTGEYESGDVVISVDQNNQIFINDEQIKQDSLLDELKKRKQNIKDNLVVIRGDRKADYEVVIKIMDYLNQAGIPKFTLATVR